MPTQPHNIVPSREPGQYALDLPNYFFRFIPYWGVPQWFEATRWRGLVRNQPIAIVCRETLIANLVALDWIITTRDGSERTERKKEIDYYTKLLTNNSGLDFTAMTEWICQDLLDLPFGAGAEIGRMHDEPDGKVVWVQPIDAGTLYPTLNQDWPIGQKVPELPGDVVYFPEHAIARVYMTPRPEIRREGWGMAPPEKIYLAIEALWRGDKYWANLLLDTPAAGILDLGDMEKASAETWVESFRALMTGIDSFKIPVLYEHTTKTEWIPFGRNPTELMFDQISMKYAGICASGYGITVDDLGIHAGSSRSGGNTMAGTIRSERKTRRTGLAVLKKKIKAFYDKILPEYLMFKWVDYDDELNVSLGRARLATATAFAQFKQMGAFSAEECRRQVIADGLFTVPVPEKIPANESVGTEVAGQDTTFTGVPQRPGELGNHQIAPSQGGYGEVTSTRSMTYDVTQARDHMDNLLDTHFKKILMSSPTFLTRFVVKAAKLVGEKLLTVRKSLIEENNIGDFPVWSSWYDDVLADKADYVPAMEMKSLKTLDDAMDDELNKDKWWEVDLSDAAILRLYNIAYDAAVKRADQKLMHDLFTAGLVTSAALSREISVAGNSAVQSILQQMADEMNDNINNGTRYYVRRAILARVKEALTQPDIIERLNNGATIEDIVSDPAFVDNVVADVTDYLDQLFQARMQIISDFELGRIENLATTTAFQQAGLTVKFWETYGPHPCVYCIQNKAAGLVPLDYEYASPLGPIQEPLAHQHCECGINYDHDDLIDAVNRGAFNLWYGD